MKGLLLAFSLLFTAGHVAAGESLLFTTESYPPFIFQEATSPIRGISVDQIKAIMEGSELEYHIEIMPWARAIALAETQPATCVFSAAQTPERLPRFKWVMPLAISRSILVKHSNSAVAAKTLEEATAFTVGTHRSDYTERLLKAMRFSKIDLSSTFDATLAKLLRDRIDLMPMSQDVYDQLLKRGTPIEKAMQFSEQRLGIACNRNVSWQTIKLLQTRLDQVISDGTQAKIYRSYGLEPPR